MKFNPVDPITFNDALRLQITILERLSYSSNEPATTLISLSKALGFKDNQETVRYLYILEGQQLVQPVPKGNLTASNWTITERGREALVKFKHLLKAA